MLLERESDFRDRVLEGFESLPPRQRRVGRYLLDHLREIPFLSVPELSRRCSASEATVVRFAQSLGYEGFTALKRELTQGWREKIAQPAGLPPAAEALARAPEDDALAAVARQETENIRKSFDELDRAAFRRVAAVLFKADHVYAFGLGISSYLADIFCYLLGQIGLRATTLSTRFSAPLEQLVTLRPTDLVAVFSFPPYSRATLDIARRAAERGLVTVAICDRATAPAAQIALHHLAVRSENMMFTNSFAAVSVLVNALSTEIALRNRDQAADAVSEITRVLREAPEVIEDGS